MGLAGFSERIAGADPDVEFALLDEVEHLACPLPQELAGERIGLDRRPLDVKRAERSQRLQRQRIGLSAGGSVENHPAEGPDRLQPLGECGLADAVVDGREALAAGDLPGPLGETFVPEHLFRARLARQAGLVGGRRGGDDAATQ